MRNFKDSCKSDKPRRSETKTSEGCHEPLQRRAPSIEAPQKELEETLEWLTVIS